MNYSKLLSLGAIAGMMASPALANELGFANPSPAGGPHYVFAGPNLPHNGNLGAIVDNSHLGPQKIVANETTGVTYVITYLPSGRSLFQADNGAEFIYDPRTQKTVPTKVTP